MTYDEIFQKLEKEINDFQKASTNTLKSNQKIIAEAKAEHEKQMQDGARLQGHIKAVKTEIAELEQELTAATDDLTQLTQTRSDQVSSLKVGDLNVIFSSYLQNLIKELSFEILCYCRTSIDYVIILISC